MTFKKAFNTGLTSRSQAILVNIATEPYRCISPFLIHLTKNDYIIIFCFPRVYQCNLRYLDEINAIKYYFQF